MRFFTHEFSKYGSYTIVTSTTPAVSASSESEINDSIATANQIRSKTLRGSIGYFRNRGFDLIDTWDNYDYFSCQVTQGGTLSIQVLADASLYSYNNSASIRNGSDTQLNYAYLSGSPRSVTISDLDAGAYYILIYAAVGHGAYQINISGDVIQPTAQFLPAVNSLPLLSE